MGRHPDFLGLGAQRAGTSWIYACLYEHPEICAPEKEINFFSRDSRWEKGFSWYESFFEDCGADQRAGEFSTSYLHHPDTPGRIHERYPDVQLIVSLRNPVDRAFSSFRNDIVAGDLPASIDFENALERWSKYVEIGRYASHLSRYLELFSRDQLLVLVYEESREDPTGFMRRIFKFLDVDPGFEPSMLEETVNPSREPVVPGVDGVLNRFASWFRASRLLRPVWWLAKISGVGSLLRQVNTAPGIERSLRPGTRRTLHREFEPEIDRLEAMLDVSLDRWRQANLGESS